MAYTTQTHAASPVLARVADFFADLAERHAKYRVYRDTLNELSTLSSRDLADLGITPGNVKSIAYQAAYK
jgi:uncharacterized protein YjiS (DUF1127 family)